MKNHHLKLSLFDRLVVMGCRDAHALSLLRANFSAFETKTNGEDLRYRVWRDPNFKNLVIARTDGERWIAAEDSEFLFLLEKDLTIELQKHRRDLYFLHAAALRYDGRVFLLVAPSGTGKSTTAWALLHEGFEYLSDELAPVDLKDRVVHPYPHALCLKQPPPAPFSLPPGLIDTGRTLHVPVGALPSRVVREAVPLAAILFLERSASASPTMVRISTAQAATRIYANALNPLAHPGEGLDGAIELAASSLCFELRLGRLPDTVALVNRLKEEISSSSTYPLLSSPAI